MKVLLLLSLLFLTSCFDGREFESKKAENPKGLPDSIDVSKEDPKPCLDMEFEGIQSISNISHNQLTLSWNTTGNFLVFKKEPDSSLTPLKTVLNANQTLIDNLEELTEYSFLVRKISGDGFLSCNSEEKKFQPLKKTVFKSCKELFDDGQTVSGVYEIDVDLEGPLAPINVYCEQEHNGGGWTLIFFHNITQTGVFLDKNEALNFSKEDPLAKKYSILNLTENMKRNDKYEFWLYYPSIDLEGAGNHWTQTSNLGTETIMGYIPIRIDHGGQNWGGLEISSSSSTLIDGSVNSGNWWFAIGAVNYYGGNLTPGPGSPVSEVVLFIK